MTLDRYWSTILTIMLVGSLANACGEHAVSRCVRGFHHPPGDSVSCVPDDRSTPTQATKP